MSRPTACRRMVLPILAAALLVIPAPTAAYAAPAPAAGTVSGRADSLARTVAHALADPAAARRITAAVATGPADLATIEPGTALAAAVRDANRAVLAAKGLPAETGSLLRLRAAGPAPHATATGRAAPVVAAAPTDDDRTAVTAYDTTGRPVRLDAHRAPTRPVLLVEVDVQKALPIGLGLVRDALAAHGVAGGATAARSAPGARTASGGYWATQVTAVRLADDKETWVKGDAEIFCLVGGFGLDGRATADVVQMPYLDNDQTTYRPRQLLVHFNGYKYDLADVVMMEDDGDTDYRALVQAIVAAILTIADVGVYIPLVNAILEAVPAEWYTDDPDFVEAWYTLSTSSTGRLPGAGGNGWIEVNPYFVDEL